MASTPVLAAENLPPQSLGRAAGSGFSWMSVSLLISKVFIFLAQVVLGWILSAEDFGVFAIVMVVINSIRIFHDGGISQVLVQRGNDEFMRLQGAAFWIGMILSVAACIGLIVASPWIAELYEDNRLVALLGLLALTLPLGSPANALRARLQLDLKFTAISIISAGRYAVRSVGMVLLALYGFGAMSFVIPLLFVAFFDDIATYMAARSKPWQSPPLVKEWPPLLKDSGWVIFTTVFRGICRNGDYLVLGLMLSQALVGQYFFGYQLTVQITTLIALNLRHVLFPVLTKLVSQPARQASAIIRTIRMLMLVAAPASILISVIIQPLEELIWHNKSAPSVPLIQIFSIVSPFLIFSDIVHASLTSRGQFRLTGVLTLVEGLWLMGSAWLAVQIAGTEDLTAISLWIFGLQILYALVSNAWILTSFQIHPLTFFRAFTLQWVAGVAAGAIAVATGWLLPAGAHPIIRICVQGFVCLTAYYAIAWAVLRPDFDELASVAPRRVGNVVRALFFLPKATKA